MYSFDFGSFHFFAPYFLVKFTTEVQKVFENFSNTIDMLRKLFYNGL